MCASSILSLNPTSRASWPTEMTHRSSTDI